MSRPIARSAVGTEPDGNDGTTLQKVAFALDRRLGKTPSAEVKRGLTRPPQRLVGAAELAFIKWFF